MTPAIHAYLDLAERAHIPFASVLRTLIDDFNLTAWDAGEAVGQWAQGGHRAHLH